LLRAQLFFLAIVSLTIYIVDPLGKTENGVWANITKSENKGNVVRRNLEVTKSPENSPTSSELNSGKTDTIIIETNSVGVSMGKKIKIKTKTDKRPSLLAKWLLTLTDAKKSK
jgi:hypothetical protein